MYIHPVWHQQLLPITKEILMNAIQLAKTDCNISEKEIQLIKKARNLCCVIMDVCGLKKDNEEFNIAMGAYDLAEACEIVRIFFLYGD